MFPLLFFFFSLLKPVLSIVLWLQLFSILLSGINGPFCLFYFYFFIFPRKLINPHCIWGQNHILKEKMTGQSASERTWSFTEPFSACFLFWGSSLIEYLSFFFFAILGTTYFFFSWGCLSSALLILVLQYFYLCYAMQNLELGSTFSSLM